MRIQASTARRDRKGDIREDGGIGLLRLKADKDHEREFITSVYRIVGGDDREEQDKGVAWMREYLKSFPPLKELRVVEGSEG